MRLFIVFLLVVLLSCVHIGASEILSAQFIGAVGLTVFVIYRWFIGRGKFRAFDWLVLMATFIVILCGLIFSGARLWSWLVYFRIFTVFVVIYLCSRLALRCTFSNFFVKNVNDAFFGAGIIILVLSVIQCLEIWVFNTRFFFLSENVYALEYGTVDRLLSTATSRPKGLFSEPSSLGAWGVLIISLGHFTSQKKFIAIGSATVFLSFALSAVVLSAVFFIIVWVRGVLIRREVAFTKILIVFFIGFLGVYLLGDRLVNVVEQGDGSANIRVFEPLRIIVEQISEGKMFGEDPALVDSRNQLEFGGVTDNFIFNQIMFYGIFGLLFLILSALSVPFYLSLIIVFYWVVNGEPFYYDRMVWLCLYVIVVSKFYVDQDSAYARSN